MKRQNKTRKEHGESSYRQKKLFLGILMIMKYYKKQKKDYSVNISTLMKDVRKGLHD